jgi:hypothetical protein
VEQVGDRFLPGGHVFVDPGGLVVVFVLRSHRRLQRVVVFFVFVLVLCVFGVGQRRPRFRPRFRARTWAAFTAAAASPSASPARTAVGSFALFHIAERFAAFFQIRFFVGQIGFDEVGILEFGGFRLGRRAFARRLGFACEAAFASAPAARPAPPPSAGTALARLFAGGLRLAGSSFLGVVKLLDHVDPRAAAFGRPAIRGRGGRRARFLLQQSLPEIGRLLGLGDAAGSL